VLVDDVQENVVAVETAVSVAACPAQLVVGFEDAWDGSGVAVTVIAAVEVLQALAPVTE
jgi:hypothetical protein